MFFIDFAIEKLAIFLKLFEKKIVIENALFKITI